MVPFPACSLQAHTFTDDCSRSTIFPPVCESGVWEVCAPLRGWTLSTMRTERGKRSGANVLALNHYLNLTVDKAKSVEENFNENFCCLCLHFDSYLPLWK